MSGSVLEVSGLTHAWKDREVLLGLDLSVRRGEVLGLLGPNGSGKSTALAVIAGLVPRQGGAIAWEGRELRSADRAFRTDLGVVFQRPAVDPKLTARQNLALAARLHALPPSVARDRAAELLAAAGLGERADDLVSEYSGGIRRRLDIARALLHEPRLLVMDEPTAGLDESSFRETWDRLQDLRRGRELTVLVATHRPDEAERCDRLAVLLRGRVQRVATPRELQELVAKDVVALQGPEPALLRERIAERFGIPVLLDEGRVLVESERGHELIPRLVEELAGLRVDSVSLRRPTLADAFLKITGGRLEADAAAARGAA